MEDVQSTKIYFFVCMFQDLATVTYAKLYNIKEIFMMETSTADLYTRFYIPSIQKIVFHLPHVRILGTNHCGNTHLKELKRCIGKQDVLCHCDY